MSSTHATTKSPSYAGFRPASEAASRSKRNNRKRDSSPELLLRRALWRRGLRYRKNVASIPGNPDVVFIRRRVAVFCDGDFWHGREWPARRAKLEGGTNASYWLKKIESNIARDAATTATLQSRGWRVIRLWETDIKRDPEAAASLVAAAVACP